MNKLSPEEIRPLIQFFDLLHEIFQREHAKTWPKCPFSEPCTICVERNVLVQQLCDMLMTIKTRHLSVTKES